MLYIFINTNKYYQINHYNQNKRVKPSIKEYNRIPSSLLHHSLVQDHLPALHPEGESGGVRERGRTPERGDQVRDPSSILILTPLYRGIDLERIGEQAERIFGGEGEEGVVLDLDGTGGKVLLHWT